MSGDLTPTQLTGLFEALESATTMRIRDAVRRVHSSLAGSTITNRTIPVVRVDAVTDETGTSVLDADGLPVTTTTDLGYVGLQFDGSAGYLPVKQPTPPRPEVVLTAVEGGILVEVTGKFLAVGGTTVDPTLTVPAAGWRGFAIHAKTGVSTFEPEPATLQALLPSAQGGRYKIETSVAMAVRVYATMDDGTMSNGLTARVITPKPMPKGGIPEVTTLPATGTDGQQVYLVAGDGRRTLMVWEQDQATPGWLAVVESNPVLVGSPTGARVWITNDGLYHYLPSGDLDFSADAAGVRFWTKTPNGSVPTISVSPTGASAFAVVDPTTGDVRASINRDGSLSGTQLSLSDADGITLAGASLTERFDAYPAGSIAWAFYKTASAVVTAQTGYYQIPFSVVAGREYRVSALVTGQSPTAGSRATLVWRYTTAPLGSQPTPPSISSTPAPGQSNLTFPTANVPATQLIQWRWTPGTSCNAIALLAFIPSASCQILNAQIWVDDLGPAAAEVGSPSTGGASEPPPPTRRTTTWSATWGESWEGGTKQGATTTARIGPRMGVESYPAWGWGTLVMDELAGATVEKIEVYVLVTATTPLGEGMSITIFQHEAATEPTYLPPTVGDGIFIGKIPSGQGKWVTVTPEWVAAFKSGAAKGVRARSNNGVAGSLSIQMARLRATYVK